MEKIIKRGSAKIITTRPNPVITPNNLLTHNSIDITIDVTYCPATHASPQLATHHRSTLLHHSEHIPATMVNGSDILLALVAIIFPPAAVAFMTGCSCDLLINIALTMLVSVEEF